MCALIRAIVLACAALLALPAVCGPRETSVWIEVTRESKVDFMGYTLYKSAEGMGIAMPGRDIITAAHVVWMAKTVHVTNALGERMPATIIGIDQDLDLALLRVERELSHVAAVREHATRTGELISAIGLREWDVTPPHLFGSITVEKWPTYAISVPVFFSSIKGERGMSGGGFYDRDGAVAAVIVRVHDELGYLSAVPIGEVCKRFAPLPWCKK